LEDRDRYTRAGRCLASRQPCSIPWFEYPDAWASVARKHYLQLDNIADRDLRIKTAIGQVRLPDDPRQKPTHDAKKGRPPKPERSRHPDSPRPQMANLLQQGKPVPVCIAVLDCLAESQDWTSMASLKRSMRERLNTLGVPWQHKAYNDPSNALSDCGFVESSLREGSGVLRRITESGKLFLRRHETCVVKAR
jgi:hypothetical protein